MVTWKQVLALGLFVAAGCLTGCAEAPPPTVGQVELERVSGKWYEIARIPHLYEYNAVAATEWFTPTKGGGMQVVHRCHQGATDGYLRTDVGSAHALDATNDKIQIDMGPAGGEFWVLDLDKDNYQYAMLGTPDRKSLWILSRKPVLPADVDEMLFHKADDLGYDTSKLRRTPQPMGL